MLVHIGACITMVSMNSNTVFCNLFSYLHPRRQSCHARVFDAHLDIAPSPSDTFEADLAEKFHKLSKCAHNNGSSDLLSLTWICQALDAVISSQASVKQALSSCAYTPMTPSMANTYSDKMIKQSVEDNAKMLDACRLLKETLFGANAYIKASRLALKRLQGLKLTKKGDFERAKLALLSAKQQMGECDILQDEVSMNTYYLAQSKGTDFTKRLQACSSMLRRMGDKRPIPSAHHQTLHQGEGESSKGSSMATLYAGEICTIFFFRVLLRALSSPGSLPSASTPFLLSRQPAWGPALRSLQEQLNKGLLQISRERKVQRGRSLLLELYTLEDSLYQILESLEEAATSEQARKDFQELVHSTSQVVDHSQRCMARLHQQLESISSSIVDIQMVLLGSSPTPNKG